ncbi:MAG TPA: hypothetical protein VFR01_05535 [Geobacterales bacterium]|nr:hypothetical protein [Geobacterales bacterium]
MSLRSFRFLSAVLGMLLLAACASSPVVLPQRVEPVAIRQTYGDYGRMALALNFYEPFLDGVRQAMAKDKEVKSKPEMAKFMGDYFAHFDEMTFTGLLVGVLKKHFTPDEASRIGSFLDTPVGEEGLKVAVALYNSDKGKGAKPTIPPDVDLAWGSFMKQPAGKKFIDELPKVSTDFRQVLDEHSRKVAKEMTANAAKRPAAPK